MVSLSFERVHRVLGLTFSGVFMAEDLEAIDPALLRVLGAANHEGRQVRGLFDMTGVEALAVPQSRFAERASKPAIGDMMRVVVAPPWAGAEFGQSYRQAQSVRQHKQPIIVGSLAEAYTVLAITGARFEPVA
jgi:hypothetical protein